MFIASIDPLAVIDLAKYPLQIKIASVEAILQPLNVSKNFLKHFCFLSSFFRFLKFCYHEFAFDFGKTTH